MSRWTAAKHRPLCVNCGQRVKGLDPDFYLCPACVAWIAAQVRSWVRVRERELDREAERAKAATLRLSLPGVVR